MKFFLSALYYTLLTVLAVLPLTAYCQKDYYRLDGKVVIEGGETYQYQLDFREKNGKISGYSLTWLDDTLPSKCLVTGEIDRNNRTITFSEKEDDNMLMLKLNDICYFNGTLAYKEIGDMFLLSGKFIGLNKYAQFCGRGEITLSHNSKGDSLLGVTVKPKQKPVPIPVKQVVEEAPTDVEVITYGSSKELNWKSDTCIMDIWDYGNVDGDIISIDFNHANVLEKTELNENKVQLRLALVPGANNIKIVAENEGTAPPNTARIQLTDGKKKYTFTAYNTMGKSATIVLKKSK